MPLGGKHMFGSIGETRVTFVEKGVTEERTEFLKILLEHNGFEVLVEEVAKREEDAPQLYTVGVTDMVFNPTIWVYQRKLKTMDGHMVSPGYWEQSVDDTHPQYWKKNKK